MYRSVRMSDVSVSRGYRLHFSREQDRRLIEVVSKNPCLYDAKDEGYIDRALREKIWTHIAQEINKSVADCKIRWKSLRNVYCKRKKQMSDDSTRPYGKWEQSLKFLDGATCSRGRPATTKPKKVEPSGRPDLVNIQMLRDANEEEVEEPEVEESEIKIEIDEMDVKEAALLSINKEESDREMNGTATSSTSSLVEEPDQESSAAARHPLQVFFDSMARTVMSFPPPLAVRAKTEVLKIISKLELEMWNTSE